VVQLSVVIPAYNEERRLPATLAATMSFLGQQEYGSEVLVVDDGSTDATVEVAGRYTGVRVLKNGRNLGKGAAVARGVTDALGEYVVFADADGSTPIAEVQKLLAAHQAGFDVAIGSRAIRGARIVQYQPWYRVMLGKSFNVAVQLLALPGIWDTQCGFKSFTREAARDIFGRRTLDGWGFDVEILFIARKRGYRIKEVGIEWEDSPVTKVNAVRDGLGMLADLARIRYQDVRGAYD